MRARSRGPDNSPLTGAPNPNCIFSSRQDWVSAVNLMSAGSVRYSVSIPVVFPAKAGTHVGYRPSPVRHRKIGTSGEEALFLEALVHVGDELAVAVPDEGRAALVGA